MIYNETYRGTARDVYDLVVLLADEEIPRDATIEMAGGIYSSDCEVWYDKDTNTVILK